MNLPEQVKLNTRRLSSFHGPMHPVILHHDRQYREIVMEDGMGRAQGYALTLFTQAAHQPELNEFNFLLEEHKFGRPARFIGETFHHLGYLVRKNQLDAPLLELPPRIGEKLHVTWDPPQVESTLSECYVRKTNDLPIFYGLMLEVIEPRFKKQRQPLPEKHGFPTAVLQRHHYTPEQVWSMLDSSKYPVPLKIHGAHEEARVYLTGLEELMHRMMKDGSIQIPSVLEFPQRASTNGGEFPYQSAQTG